MVLIAAVRQGPIGASPGHKYGVGRCGPTTLTGLAH